MEGNSRQSGKTSDLLLKWILITMGTIFVGIAILGITLFIILKRKKK